MRMDNVAAGAMLDRRGALTLMKINPPEKRRFN
jgi:hypothetical protein